MSKTKNNPHDMLMKVIAEHESNLFLKRKYKYLLCNSADAEDRKMYNELIAKYIKLAHKDNKKIKYYREKMDSYLFKEASE